MDRIKCRLERHFSVTNEVGRGYLRKMSMRTRDSFLRNKRTKIALRYLARFTLAFCPPLRLTPLSPTAVWSP